MDRIVRPQGFIIVRDKRSLVEYIMKHLPALHWESVGTGGSVPDSDEEEAMTVLVIQKKLWHTTESVGDSD